jgi:hypothetical protein
MRPLHIQRLGLFFSSASSIKLAMPSSKNMTPKDIEFAPDSNTPKDMEEMELAPDSIAPESVAPKDMAPEVASEEMA